MCRFCLNARVDDELSDNNDLSYHTVGSTERDYRLMIRAGDLKPVAIISEYHTIVGWKMNSVYHPKFCPECGRPLMTDYPEWRKLYGTQE